MSTYQRISAVRGQTVDLNIRFFRNGVPLDPYAIREVDIYHTSIAPHNLVATIPVLLPTDPLYPRPLEQGTIPALGPAGTEPVPHTPNPGEYHLFWSIPSDLTVPDVFFDVWKFFAENPCGQEGTAGATGCNVDAPVYAPLLLSQCGRFWVYAEQVAGDLGLESVNFGFEPLNVKFHQPEVRPLEVGIMPLPLYDYNFNLVNPLIPQLKATISIETQYRELLVNAHPMTIGVRQGSYRSNPYVLRYMLDTTILLKGTYQYYIVVTMPDGSTRASARYIFTVN